MTSRVGPLLLFCSLAACTGSGPVSSSGGFGAIGGSGTIGSTSGTGGTPNSSLEGDLSFVPGSQSQNPGSMYPDGGIAQLVVTVTQSSYCSESPPWLFITLGAVGGPALAIGDYPVGDGGTSAPAVDAGASVMLYLDGPGLAAVDGFVFLNVLGTENTIGNFNVDLALADGGTSNLAGSFDVSTGCEGNNQ